MRRYLVPMAMAFAVAIVVLAPVLAARQQKPEQKPVDVTGKWTMTLQMEVGTASPALVFKQVAGKLTGTYTGRYGESALEGKLEARKVTFQVTIPAEGTPTVMSFSGEVAETGETMGGDADLGGMGAATWSAKRDKK